MKEYSIMPEDYLIMIVDDEHAVRMLTEEIISALGYKVIGFDNPLTALSYYQKNYREIDFTILDMMMPEMNGAELYYKLQRVNPFLEAIVLSGYDGVESKYKHLMEDGLKGFYTKPIDVVLIDSKIKEVLINSFTIDTTAGLSTLMNNEKIYQKLLITYHEENKNLDEKIMMKVHNNDFDGVANIFHKIKGISLNLSSKITYDLSKSLNRKFIENDYVLEDIHYFIKHHYLLIKDIERLMRRIDVHET